MGIAEQRRGPTTEEMRTKNRDKGEEQNSRKRMKN